MSISENLIHEIPDSNISNETENYFMDDRFHLICNSEIQIKFFFLNFKCMGPEGMK
jgi:hypothetical protein